MTVRTISIQIIQKHIKFQFDQPIGENGYIDIEVDGETKRIGITRLHMEEDAGKSTHKGEYSLVDLNRQGTPLIEIVSEPDIRSPKEAYAYLEKLRSIIQYTGVSDVKMEEDLYVVMLTSLYVHMVKKNLVLKPN